MKWIYPIIAKVGEIIAKIIEVLWALAKFVGGWIKEHIVDPIVGKIIEIYEKVKEWVAKAWSAITDVFEKLADWFHEKWEAVKKVFEPVTTWLSEKFGEAWEKIKEKFASWSQFWGGLWDKVKEKFSALGTKISDAIGGAVKAGINKVLDLIEGKINGAIGLINRAIDFINELPGVSIEPVSEVSLPRLAKGGVLPKGQVGLLEGSGTEAVVPLERNKQWIRAVANDLLNELKAGTGVGAAANSVTNNSTQNFTQIINAPKQPSRIELYRQTRNLLAFAKEAGGV
jgi:phage-related protein